MFKIAKIAALALLVFFASCKKDEETSGSDVVGTWNLTETSCDDGNSTTTVSGVTATATFKWTGKNFAAKLVFNTDGSYTSSGSYTQVLTTIAAGQTITQEIPLNDFFGTGTYKISGKTMTATASDGTSSTAEILEQTSTKLRFKYSLNRTTNQSGATVVQKGSIYYTLTK